MREDRRRPDTAEMTLALLAWRYAAGELAPDEAAAFEGRLGTDAAAQTALAEAVRLSARAVGQDPPAPDPLTRAAIVERLRPVASVLGWVLRRRPYRGHPLTWAGVGAGVAAGVLGVGMYLAPDPGAIPEPVAVQAPADPVPDMNRTVAVPDPAPPRAEGGGGGDALPQNPATTFLPPLGPPDGEIERMRP